VMSVSPTWAGALEAVDGEEVDAELDGRLGMADRGALVQDRGTGGFELLDDGPWAVAGRLDNVNLLLDDDAGVGGVVRGDHGGEESEVDAEGVLCHGAAAPDLFAQVLGCGLGEGRQDSKSSSVTDGAGKLGISNPLHSTLHNGDSDAEGPSELGVERHVAGT